MENEKEGEVNGTQNSPGLNDWLTGSPIQDRKCYLESQAEGDEFGLEDYWQVFSRRSG